MILPTIEEKRNQECGYARTTTFNLMDIQVLGNSTSWKKIISNRFNRVVTPFLIGLNLSPTYSIVCFNFIIYILFL